MDKVFDDMMKKLAGEDVFFVFLFKVEGVVIDELKKVLVFEKKLEEVFEKKLMLMMLLYLMCLLIRFVSSARRSFASRVAS